MKTVFSKAFVAVAATALLSACAEQCRTCAAIPDPSNAACTVTQPGGKVAVVNSGYQCGDPKRSGDSNGS